MALIDHIHFYALLIEANGFKACLCLLNCQRQTHIAHSDDAYGNFFFCYFIQE